VDNKGNKQWVWLALDADTREILGVYIGARDEAAARKFPKNLVLLQISRESHRCYLVFHPSLQCIITCIALPSGQSKQM
jgi:IS1 family transposase